MEHSVGYIASVLMGIALGITGGGGSVITVPILVYLFRLDPVQATGYSLFLVGITSLVGSVRSAVAGAVDFRKAFILAVPAAVAVFLVRHTLMPLVPPVLSIGHTLTITRNMAMMGVFALSMMVVSWRMMRKPALPIAHPAEASRGHYKTWMTGLVVGVWSGVIGAGGGFLIVPALLEFEHLPIRRAVGTSLVIISINSLVGFLGDLSPGLILHTHLLITLSALSVAGVWLGHSLSHRLSGEHLRKVMGWFILLMGLAVAYKELVLPMLH